MITYLIINPFNDNATHGIANYLKNLRSTIAEMGTKVDYIANNQNLTPEKFRQFVYSYVHSNYGMNEVIIEAPEARAPTLLLENYYRVHVRLHAPGYVADKYNRKQINQSTFSDELRAIHKARVVSSPSYGLLNELQDELNTNDFNVFKNPTNNSIKTFSQNEKEIDVIFLGRFQYLKGVNFLNPILELLPASFKVALVGSNSTKFTLSKRVKCMVESYEHIDDDSRFELVGKAKCLLLLSHFENCSMVALESICSGTKVYAWDVGGNNELAINGVLETFVYGDIDSIVSKVVSDVQESHFVSPETFIEAGNKIQSDFTRGLNATIQKMLNSEMDTYRSVLVDSPESAIVKEKLVTFNESYERKVSNLGERIFGFSVSNEHIEEMWMPIIKKIGADYRFVCKRPLGFMQKFGNPIEVDCSKYSVYDWIKYSDHLCKQIAEFKPNKIFFHNGLHPSYQHVLEKVKSKFSHVPIVYTELGWLPQKNHIYFDEWGTNGKSKLANLTYGQLTLAEERDSERDKVKLKEGHILVVTQLENDTNILVNSPYFKNNEQLVSFIIDQLSCFGKIYIKTHPLDNHKNKLDVFTGDNVEVLHEGDLEDLLEGAKAVVGINSTVLIEALKYDCNVFALGKSIISNKGVVVEYAGGSLSELWCDSLYASRTKKNNVLEALKERQINLDQVESLPLHDWVKKSCFEPLMSSCARYSIDGSPPKKVASQSKFVEAAIKKDKNKSNFNRKLKKLKTNPVAFFQDSKFVKRLTGNMPT